MNEYKFDSEVANLNIAILGSLIYNDIVGILLYREDNKTKKLLLNLVFENFFKTNKGTESLFFKNQKKLTNKDIRDCAKLIKIINRYICSLNNKLFQEAGIELHADDLKPAVSYAFAKILRDKTTLNLF